MKAINIVILGKLDGTGTEVQIQDDDGKQIKVGEWSGDPSQGRWKLRIIPEDFHEITDEYFPSYYCARCGTKSDSPDMRCACE